MIKGLYTSAMGMLMQEAELNVTTNNLANVKTKGYKRDRLTVEEFPHLLELRLHDKKLAPGQKHYMPPVLGGMGTGVIMDRVTTDHEGGPKVETENKTDFAIRGKAYFMLETPRGIRFTRDGQFEVDANGNLVTKQGYKVLGFQGEMERHRPLVQRDKDGVIQPIEHMRPLNVGDPKHFEVDLHGEITNSDLSFAKVVFQNTNSIQKDGNNVFEILDDAKVEEVALYDTDYTMHQGFLEESNVNIVREMVHMIRIQRAYEANSKILTGIDDVSGQAVRQLGTLR